MTDIRALSMCVEIADRAIAAGKADSLVGCLRVVRKTPWGRAVSIRTIRAAIETSGLLTYLGA